MHYGYPKVRHRRQLAPGPYVRYQQYKRHLQREFARVCVYCRQPDSQAANQVFGVDHYRPKKRFPDLVCHYPNLYYCCNACNSRKSNYWPLDEAIGPYVVNPCDHAMADHLRLDAKEGRVVPKTEHGRFTERLLLLNDAMSVQARRVSVRLVENSENQLRLANARLKNIEKKRRRGEITAEQFDLATVELIDIRAHLIELIEMQIGSQAIS